MRSAIPRWFIGFSFLTFLPSLIEAAPRWNYLSGPDLEVVGPVSEEAAVEMARRLALFRQLFLKTVGISREGGPPLRVYLFEGDRELEPFLPLKDGKPLQSSGFFHRDLDRETLVLHLGARTRQTSELAFHLYAHLLSGQLTDWPAWWKEGLAELLSTAEFGTTKVRLGQAPERHLTYLRTHAPLPLAELFAVDRNALSYDEGTKSGPFYATSWLLVHKLLVKGGLKHLVGANEFNRLLSIGNDPQQSLTKAFQIDVAALDADLKKTGRQFAFSAMQVDFEGAWDAQKKSTTQPSPAEVQAYLGDLLYRSLRETDAEDWFNKAIALEPRLPLPYEGLGWLRIHQNRRREAAEFFKQANQYGSKNALSHYQHAEMLLQDLSKDTENGALADLARSELETAIQLRPDFAAAHYSVAHLSLMLGRGFEEGIPHAEVAIRLEPDKPQYVLALAGLLFYSKRFTEARAALEPLLTAATAEGYKGPAESLRDMIEESISRKRSLEDLLNHDRPVQPKEP